MKKVLVTGGAGFIGSNLIKELLERNYQVVCLDNLSTGSIKNIEEFLDYQNFEFIEGDVLDYNLLTKLSDQTYAVSHQAALGSVPRSIHDPLETNMVNVNGTLNVFKACVDNKIDRVVYAASSSTYGDSIELPKTEERIGNPISPYAVTKLVNELYASVFQKVYGLNSIGLRYFNVFGPKQNPNGAYAAVIPLFIQDMLSNKNPIINGDGNHSRDFTYVANVVEANIQSLESPIEKYNDVYNIALGHNTTLNELVTHINRILNTSIQPNYREERPGDVRHSLADISKARIHIGYDPKYPIEDGLKQSIEWYKKQKY